MGNPLCPRWFWRVVFRTLYFTGIRRRQLVALQWQDVNLDAREIHLRYECRKDAAGADDSDRGPSFWGNVVNFGPPQMATG